MIKLEKAVFPSEEQWNAVIRGVRNPYDSWDKSDTEWVMDNPFSIKPYQFHIGEADLALMQKLANAGSVHGKFMRMLPVIVDITAPLYWWKEADTYKVGTVANSCSTMHKIHAYEFTWDMFSHEYLSDEGRSSMGQTINTLNFYRERFLETKDKVYWYQMIQLLPSSYNQKRTWSGNYQVLQNIYYYRKDHRLDEWHKFCDWIETVPHSELITGLKNG